MRNDRDALVLSHLPLADAAASAMARRLAPLVERDDLIQEARIALLRAALRWDPSRPAAPYLKRCIQGALQHHLRDQVRLVRISRRAHESGRWGFTHASLDAPHPGGGSWLDQLSADGRDEQRALSAHQSSAAADISTAPEDLLEQLPAHQAAALRLTILQGLSLRKAARALNTSCSTIRRRRQQGLLDLRARLTAA